MCLELNAAWVPYILGCLMQLVQPTTWATDDPAALFEVQTRATELIDAWGNAGVCDVLTFRCEPGDDASPQYSTDGGATWTDLPDCFTGAPGAPGAPGPTGPAGIGITSPPVIAGQTTAQRACSIAAYLAQLIQSSIAKALASYDALQSDVLAVAALTALIPFVDLVVPEAIVAGVGLYRLFTAGTRSDLAAASTDATLLHNLDCALYLAIAADGEITAANAAAVIAAIGAVSYAHSDVHDAVMIYVNGLGARGLMAAQQLGPLMVGDCSTCSACVVLHATTVGTDVVYTETGANAAVMSRTAGNAYAGIAGAAKLATDAYHVRALVHTRYGAVGLWSGTTAHGLPNAGDNAWINEVDFALSWSGGTWYVLDHGTMVATGSAGALGVELTLAYDPGSGGEFVARVNGTQVGATRSGIAAAYRPVAWTYWPDDVLWDVQLCTP